VARRRPTLPRLKTQYHGRWGVSRPSSRWDRVYHPRDGHRATRPDPVEYHNIWMVIVDLVIGNVCALCVARLGAARGVGSLATTLAGAMVMD
jgi:hypothetical protein